MRVKYQPKTCPTCKSVYTPTSGRQGYCPDCRATLPVCDCGSYISGPARWGAMWGGECDRAEARASALLDRLAPTTAHLALAA